MTRLHPTFEAAFLADNQNLETKPHKKFDKNLLYKHESSRPSLGLKASTEWLKKDLQLPLKSAIFHGMS